MSKQKSFSDKVTSFIFGEPIPVLSAADLQNIHKLRQKLDTLLKQLDGAAVQVEAPPAGTPPAADLTEQVRKLAKTQFKANTLQESQLAQQQDTLAGLQKAIERQESVIAELTKQREQAVVAAQLELLKRVLPALDSLDAAFSSGRRQVLKLPMERETRQAIIAWLDGIRLARMRLLDLLAAHDIRPIPTVGRQFDPHYHLAVAINTTGQAPDGIIINEDRPGYASPTQVLREAEVVVARSG